MIRPNISKSGRLTPAGHVGLWLLPVVLGALLGAGATAEELGGDCQDSFSTCYECSPEAGCIPNLLKKNLAQTQNCSHNADCADASGALGSGDACRAPVLNLSGTYGKGDDSTLTRTPNPVVNHTPLSRQTPAGPAFALHLYAGNRYDGSNNGKSRRMGNVWSHNYERFLTVTLDGGGTPVKWKMRDESGTGPNWWVTNGIIEEYQSTDYGWTYRLDWHAQTNDYGRCVIVHKRRPETKSDTRGACGTCGSCGSCGHTQPAPTIGVPGQAACGGEGYVFEPVDTSGVDRVVDYYRLKQVVGADGQALTFGYASPTNDLITNAVDACGNEFRFGYDGSGYLTGVTDVAGDRTTAFRYTTVAGQILLTNVVDMGGQEFQYQYIDTNRLSALLRPHGDGEFLATRMLYDDSDDGDGRACTVELPDGKQVSFRQSVDGKTIYDNRSGLGAWQRRYARITQPTVPVWQQGASDITQTNLTSPDGRVFRFEWNSAASNSLLNQTIKTEWRPDGTVRHYDWDDHGGLRGLVVRDADENVLLILTNTVDCFSGTDRPELAVREERDAGGNVLAKTSRHYRRYDGPTTNAYDDTFTLEAVRTWVASNAYAETLYAYDTNTFRLSEVQELVEGTNVYRTTSRYGHDGSNRVAWVADALSNTTWYAYDDASRIRSVTQTNSGVAAVTTYDYDAYGRVTGVVYPDSTTDSWNYAACNCTASHVDRGGNVTTNYFDSNGWVWKTITWSPAGTQLAYEERRYNSNRDVTNSVDALGQVSTRLYDIAGRLSNTVDRLGRSTRHLYDSAGRQYLTVFNDGTYASNTYDSAGHVIAETRCDASGTALTWTAYTVDPLGRRVATTDALGNVTSNTTDMAGRVVRVDYPDGSYARTVYDLSGKAVLQIGPVFTAGEEAQATTSNRYDELDRLVAVTDPAGRATAYVYDSDWPRQVRHTVNANSVTNESNWHHPLSGRLMSNCVDGVVTVYAYDRLGQVTNVLHPDGSSSAGVYDGTRLVRQISRTGLATGYGFDALGRRTSVTNAQGHATRHEYDQEGQLTKATDPLLNETGYSYDNMGRQTEIRRPDGSVTTNVYDSLGRPVSRTGAGAVPVSYRYDALGRMTNLVDGEGNVTVFAHDAMGRLVRKTYADSTFYSYGYNARGWLTNRVDALGRATGYAYSPAGELTRIDYLTDTDVTYSHDNLGRMTGRVDAAGTWTWTYLAESSRVLTESLSASFASSAVSYSYASNTLDLLSVATAASTTLYSWACGRLTNVAWQAGVVSGSAAYAYPSNSDFLAATVYSGAGLTVTRLYDDADRLTNIAATSPGGAVNSFGYQLDAVGRRVRREDADNSRIDWGYDRFDQLTSAARTNGPSGAADAAYRFGYQYDLVGNRTNEQRGQLTLVGAHNELNQLTARDWSGLVDVYGTVLNTAIVVVVNGVTSAPPYLVGRSWLGGASAAAGSNAVSVVGWLAGSNTLGTNFTVYMPTPKPQAFQYDLNGNLTNDGQRSFYWDEENRLAAIEALAVAVPAAARRRGEYLYDAQSRRIRSVDSQWSAVSSQWSVVTDRHFVYDGWNVLAEYAETPTPPNAYTNLFFWGLDLSQSLQGAGGIGGLLSAVYGGTTSASSALFTYDGNGNVADLVDSAGATVAHYEYDPFGRTVAQSGPLAAENRWRFSTKWCEEAWGLSLHGDAWLVPDVGVWIGRDAHGKPKPTVFGGTALTLVQRCWRAVDEVELEYGGLVSFFGPASSCRFKWPPVCEHSDRGYCRDHPFVGGYYNKHSGHLGVCVRDRFTLEKYKSIVVHEIQHAYDGCSTPSKPLPGCLGALCREYTAYYCQYEFPNTRRVDWTWLSWRAWDSAKTTVACCQERVDFPGHRVAGEMIRKNCPLVSPNQCWQRGIRATELP